MSAADHSEKPKGRGRPPRSAGERRYRTLVENLSVGVYRSLPDERGTILDANPAAARMLGYDSVESLTAVGTAATYENPPEREALLAELREKGVIQDRQVRLRKKDGTRIWASCTVSAEFDGQGQVKCIDGILEDVTARMAIEEALRDSEQWYRGLVESRSDLIVRVDGEGRFTFVNDAFCRKFGKSREELLGRPYMPLVYEEDLPGMLATVASLRDPPHRIVRMQVRARTAEGVRWMEWEDTAVLDEEGRIAEIQGIGRDVTESRQAEDALRLSEEKYRLLVESAGEAIATMDADGVYLFMNTTAAARMAGRPEDFVGKTMWDVFPKQIADRQADSVRQVIRTGEGLLVEDRTVIQGRARWYRTSVEPIRDVDGAVRAALIIARDTSELRLAQQALEAAHRELIDTREAERKHLARELHDSIGQELVALKMAAQAAGSGRAIEADLADRLAGLSDRCGRLIKEVRGICHGLYPPTLESLGLVAALRQLGQDCKPKMGFRLTCPPELAESRLAPDCEIALFRIAQEAIANALRHSRAGNVRLELKEQDGWIRLRVSDNGRGFDLAGEAGSGLGLSTMRDRARAVGGTLEITSRAGRTRIDARVPAGGAAPPKAVGSRRGRGIQ